VVLLVTFNIFFQIETINSTDSEINFGDKYQYCIYLYNCVLTYSHW